MYTFIVLSLFALACSATPYGYSKTSLPSPIAQLREPISQVREPISQVQEPFSQVQEPISQVRETYVPVQQSYGPIEAAVNTRRTYEVRNVLVDQPLAQPQVIEISPNVESVQIVFRTQSSRLNVQQQHIPSAPALVEHSAVQENAHRLVHEVTRPVIQDVREIIQPYRRMTQEIRPVIEEIHTVVHKGERRVAEPLPVKGAAPAYGAGALKGGVNAVNAAKGYKAAKAA